MLQAVAAIATLTMLGGLVFLLTRTPQALARRIWLVAFTIVVGGSVTMMAAHSFIAKWAFKGDGADGLERLMDGTAERPFVYRRLAPDIVRVTTDLALPRLPPRAISYFEERSPLRRYRYLWGDDAWTERKAVAFHVAYFLTWAALFGTLLVGAGLHRTLSACSWLEALATASLIMCLVPLMFVGGGYVYDAPELFLWTTVVLLAVRGHFWAVPPFFALMLVNKESALLAAPVLFPIVLRRRGTRRAVIWTLALGAMGCAWLWFVRAKFASMPGKPMDFWLPINLAFWSRPKSYFLFAALSSPGLPSPRGANILSLALLLIPMRFGWRAIRPELRWAAIIMGAELAPLFLASCGTDEVRNLSLMYPLILIPVVQGVRVLFKVGSTTTEGVVGG